MSERTISATVTWKIKNYSCCWHRKEQGIASPRFLDVQGTPWRLEIYPRGISSNNTMTGVYLINLKQEKIFENTYEISLLDVDAKQLICKKLDQYPSCKHYCKSLCFDDILKYSDKYLLEDVLTLRCDIFTPIQTSLRPLQVIISSCIPITKTTFTWSITDFCSRKSSKHLCPLNVLEEKDLCILELSYSKPNEKPVLIVGCCGIMQKSHCVKINLRIRDKLFLHCTFDELPCKKSVSPVVSWDAIVADKSGYLLNNVLSWKCEVVLICKEIEQATSSGICEESKQTTMNTQLKRTCQLLTKTTQYDAVHSFESSSSIKKDFQKLYEDGTMTDFTIKVQSEQFNVHTQVLAARSAVFERMLQTDMKEKTDKCLIVDDLSIDTVKRTINFMYTDDPGELTEDSVLRLFHAGDKYEIFGLKQMCATFMHHRISEDNVCHVLEMADRHSDQHLKKSVFKYIFDHEEDVVLSKKFQELSKSNPRVTAEVCVALAKLRFSYR